MNRPTPDPSQEGSKQSSASCRFPSWEGLGVGSWSQCTALKSSGLHQPLEAPPGFRVRQSSGALAMQASQPKAPEDWRSPRPYRAIRRFVVRIRDHPARKIFSLCFFVCLLYAA